MSAVRNYEHSIGNVHLLGDRLAPLHYHPTTGQRVYLN